MKVVLFCGGLGTRLREVGASQVAFQPIVLAEKCTSRSTAPGVLPVSSRSRIQPSGMGVLCQRIWIRSNEFCGVQRKHTSLFGSKLQTSFTGRWSLVPSTYTTSAHVAPQPTSTANTSATRRELMGYMSSPPPPRVVPAPVTLPGGLTDILLRGGRKPNRGSGPFLSSSAA